MRGKRAAALFILGLLGWNGSAENSDFRSFLADDGTRLEFRLAAPSEKRQEYPVLLALPPGPQTAATVDWGMENLYQNQAMRRGWVVISPAAPADRLFFQGSEKYLPQLLSEAARRYPPEGGKFHLAGVSNGGLAAFRAAILYPELFHSIAVFPGWPSPDDLPSLNRIAGIPLRMWVGERETEQRIDLMKRAQRMLRAQESEVELIVLPGEGHNLISLLGGEAIFEFLEQQRRLRRGVAAR